MDTTKQSNLVVGVGVQITGKVEVPGLLMVHGTVDGEVQAGSIEVAPTGRIEGAVTADNAEIRGYIGKTLTVNERLTVRSTAQLMGEVNYQIIEIEAGARIQGALKQNAERKSASVAYPSFAAEPKSDSQEEGGSDVQQEK
jgi:cytoskeletal protein CcmA (bactofilin family)